MSRLPACGILDAAEPRERRGAVIKLARQRESRRATAVNVNALLIYTFFCCVRAGWVAATTTYANGRSDCLIKSRAVCLTSPATL